MLDAPGSRTRTPLLLFAPLFGLVSLLAVVWPLVATDVAVAAEETTTEEGTEQGGEQQPEGPELFGVIRGPEGDPLPDVELVVSREGNEVATATTNEEGRWSVIVPEAGTYQVELVTDSLPEGVTLAEGASNPLEVTVGEGRRQAVAFRLSAGEGGAEEVARRFLQPFLTDLLNGIKLGAIIAITSVGLSLIFGVTGLINFAHGEIVVFGALAAYYLNAWDPGPNLHLLLAAPIAILAGGGFGWALERGMFRPLRHRKTGALALLLFTVGLSILLRNVFLMFFGGTTRSFAQYNISPERDFFVIRMSPRDVAIILISVVVLVSVGLLLRRTRLGTAMRAVADNRDLAESSGIDVQRVILATWVGGSALAALGGIFQGLTNQIDVNMGFNLLLLMFAGIILGGIGTAYGAIAGGLVIGIVTSFATRLDIQLNLAFAFLVLIVVLLIRPQGIFGRRERIG